MGDFWYNTGKLRCWAGAAGEIDLLTEALVKCMALQTDDDTATFEFIGDVLGGTGVEVTSDGYTGGFGGAGRKALAGKALTVDQGNNRAEFDCSDITWASIGAAPAQDWVALLIVLEDTNDATSPVIAHIDSATGLPLTPNGSDITLTIDAEGLLHIT